MLTVAFLLGFFGGIVGAALLDRVFLKYHDVAVVQEERNNIYANAQRRVAAIRAASSDPADARVALGMEILASDVLDGTAGKTPPQSAPR